MQNMLFYPTDGQCNYQFCTTEAKFRCAVCNDGYCSLLCQSLDWRRHKPMCKSMPALLPLLGNPILHSQPMNVQNINPNAVLLSAIPSLIHRFKVNTEEAENREEPPSNAQKERAALISVNHEKNYGAEQFQVNGENHEEAIAALPPRIFGKEAVQSQAAAPSVTLMPTIGAKREDAPTSQGQSALKVAKPIAASPPRIFGKEAAQTQAAAPSGTLMPTIGAKREDASTSQGQSALKVAKPIAALPPRVFGKEAAQTHASAPSATLMPTIGAKREDASTSQGQSALKVAKPIAALPPRIFEKEAAQTQAAAPSVTLMPTIGEKREDASTSQGQSALKVAKPIAASPPRIFGKEAVQTRAAAPSVTLMPSIGEKLKEASFPPMIFGTEAAKTHGKGSSIFAMPAIDVQNEEAAQTQETSLSKVAKPVFAFPPIIFGKKVDGFQENKPLASAFKAESTGYLKSIISDKADEALTTKKTEPFDVAVKSIEKPLTITDEWKTPYEIEFMKYLTFRVQHVVRSDPEIIWIIDERYLSLLEELKDHMEKFVLENFHPAPKESIAEGMLLIALSDCHKLYRVKVIQNSVQQNNYLVQAIDYGKKFYVDCNKLFKPSAQVAGMKAFAFPVEIEGKAYDGLIQLEEKIHLRLIKAVAGVDGLIKAEIHYNPNESLIQFLLLNDNEIKILKISDDGQSALVHCPQKFNVIAEDLTKAIESSDLKKLYVTKETSLAAVHTTNGWQRGVIIDSLPGNDLHLIYVIDEGCLKIGDKLKCLPEQLAQIPACSFAITGKGVKIDFEKFDINNGLAKFQILYESDKKLMLYCDSTKIGEIYLKSYFADREICHKLAIKEINESGSDVFITKLINHAQVYINLVDSQQYPRLFGLLIRKCSKYIKERPTMRDIVLVKATGENCYRGEIINVSSDNKDIFDVWNVDTGNLHKSVHVNTMFKPCSFIRYLPRHLQELKLTMLHTIPAETLPTETISALLQRLHEYIEEKTLFEIEYPGNSYTEGNLLFLNRNGISLSMELLPLLNQHDKERSPSPDVDQKSDDTLTNVIATIDGDDEDEERKNSQYDEDIFESLPPSPPDSPQPVMKKSDKENLMKHVTVKNTFQTFTLQDVTVKNIPAGQNIDIFMLDDSNLKPYGYICCTYFANQAEINEFHNNLEKVHTYGQSTQNEIPEDYVVGIDEICVAMLKEDERWYRAHCVSHDNDDMITIMFLDFGNIQQMKKSEVLPLTKDLLYPIYANFCYIDGYKVNEPNPEVDNYLVKNEKRLNCRQIIAAGEPGYSMVKLNM